MVRYKLYEFVLSHGEKGVYSVRVTKAIKAEQLALLEEHYFDAKPALEYTNEFELLVAVVLSAQCTDERVNIVTKRLFPVLNHPAKMLEVGVTKLETLIKDCGLYKSKAKNLIATCHILVEQYHGEVPREFDQLVELPGVGRKTAKRCGICIIRNTSYCGGYTCVPCSKPIEIRYCKDARRNGTKIAKGYTKREVVCSSSLADLSWTTCL